jgi:hypothetical protein
VPQLVRCCATLSPLLVFECDKLLADAQAPRPAHGSRLRLDSSSRGPFERAMAKAAAISARCSRGVQAVVEDEVACSSSEPMSRWS